MSPRKASIINTTATIRILMNIVSDFLFSDTVTTVSEEWFNRLLASAGFSFSGPLVADQFIMPGTGYPPPFQFPVFANGNGRKLPVFFEEDACSHGQKRNGKKKKGKNDQFQEHFFGGFVYKYR